MRNVIAAMAFGVVAAVMAPRQVTVPVARMVKAAYTPTVQGAGQGGNVAWLTSGAAGQLNKLGTLTSTGTSVNNSTTASPFGLACVVQGCTLLVQCDAAALIYPGSTASATITASTYGVKLAANDQELIWLNALPAASSSATAVLAMISVTGTANCAVWNYQ